MKEILTTITKKGQVTIPVEIRRLLGFKPKDKVVFMVEGENVRIAPAKYNLENIYVILKPLNKPEDFKKLKETAIKEHVKKFAESL